MNRRQLWLCGIGALVAGASAASAQPRNDTCATAASISLDAVAGTTIGAANDGSATCGLSATAPDVYYRFVAPSTCDYEVLTCNGNTFYDTVISVHSACPAGTGNQIVCNDDACGLRSGLTFAGTQGTAYIIRVAGYNGRSGDFNLSVRQLGRPANDTCAGATVLVGPAGAVSGDTTCAMLQSSFNCVGNGSPGVYYSWIAPADGVATFETCAGASYDTAITVSTGCPASDLNQIACNDDACGLRSNVQFPTIAGTEYFIRVAGFSSQRGTFQLNWGFAPGPRPNDLCVNAHPISNGVYAGSTSGMAANGSGCFNTPDVYYVYRSPVDAIVQIDTCTNSNYDTALSVHSACPADASTQIACNDDACGLRSVISFSAAAGVPYIIRVAGFAGAGEYTLNVRSQADAITLDPSTLSEFYLLPRGGTIGEFRAAAASFGGYLAGIGSFSEAQFVKNVANSRNVFRSAAIGLSDETTEGSFVWDSGQPTSFAFWNFGEPNDASGEDYTHIVDAVTGVWNDYPGAAQPGMYAVAESDRAPLNVVLGNGRIYVLFKATSWQGAQARARAMGGNLVTINDAAENEFVRANIGAPGIIWIGLSDAGAEGTFVWADGTALSYTNWAPGEPNNLFNEDYIEMNPVNGLWNDRPNLTAGTPVYGVAEIVLPNQVGAPVRGPGGCGAFVLVGPTNWYPAQFYARSIGGNIASVRNAAENEFIRSTFAAPGGRRLWLGATDRDDEDRFVWMDGSPFGYSNFAAGEPNNAGATGNEDYLEMINPVTGEWNDVSTVDAASNSFFAVVRLECPCDWNATGNINSQDFFDFLSSFFTGQGDYNCDGVNNSQDFFDFLACFFSPPASCQ